MKIIFSLFLALSFFPNAWAADWPKRTIKLTVGFGAGGTTDSTARLLAKILEKDLGKRITVINKPGGGGSVAAALTRAQRPDGYNLFTLATGASVLMPHMLDLPYDPLKDFTFIAQYATWNFGIVAPVDAPFETLQELIEFARQRPGSVSYGIGGAGTPPHLAMERLAQVEGLDWKAIPYTGGTAAVTALLGGHITIMAGSTEWLSQVKAGRFKLLAILSDKRMPDFPEVPTLLDLGYEIAAPSILGIAGPAGIPDEVVAKLESSIASAMKSAEMENLIRNLAMQIEYRNSADFEAHVRREHQGQGDLIQSIGLAKQ
ncbi:MAG: tripartite tricarboxylate transporter substrate binding protein [Candidatus Nitrohelix vancouverensis]|uniref:Tripartite tricarboxylate transporter substrate binding protein n=1 Tax=Candidatus Nitrohelix vancouverensis TaxID=2705534 RepID=A0A7T0C0N7_9BACT|nr:MAG: tripartite tricarboxylate transporter substrate binding protein [Candidatus Nitrohelix vancouverensis]